MPISFTELVQKNLFRAHNRRSFESLSIDIEKFIGTFKDIQSSLPIANASFKDVLQKCSVVCLNFQTSLKIYNKFDNVWAKLGIRDIEVNQI